MIACYQPVFDVNYMIILKLADNNRKIDSESVWLTE